MLSEIFKAYDVRGIYGKSLTDEIAYRIGKAFVSFLKCKDVVVGYDMRTSSPKLAAYFMKGANEQGANAIDIGMVSTDVVYFASGSMKKAAVMFTASHNPGNYNGIKFCRKGAVPINYDTGLKNIMLITEKSAHKNKPGYKTNFIGKYGKIIKKNILGEYAKHSRRFISSGKLRKLKIAADAGNGMAGKMIPLVYKSLNAEIVPLYFELDGAFPNHPADPSKYENLKDLQNAVMREKCDFGMAFDGDADRIFFVDEKGSIINSSLISAMIAKHILLRHKNEKVVYNLICSRIVPETVKKYHGKAVIERVGHSYMKDTMGKTKAIFGCEHSAHYYFRGNYRADSGIIASVIVADIVSREKMPLSALLKEFEKYYKIEETNFEVKDKQKALESIEQHYKKLKPKSVSKLDGITFDFENWWFNVRQSNTEPLLRLNLEADSENLMNRKKKELVEMIAG